MKTILITNSLFSLTSGITSLFTIDQINKELGLENQFIIPIISFGLIVFSAYILWIVQQQKTSHITVITALDFGWVFGTVVLCLLPETGISNFGKTVLISIGIIVLSFGIIQWKTVNDLG